MGERLSNFDIRDLMDSSSLARQARVLTRLYGSGRGCGLDYLQKTQTTALVPDRHRISADPSNQP